MTATERARERENWSNRTLFHGDNLGFLQGINSGTIDLIATDPPFNKNRDFHATPDSLAKGAKFKDRWSWDDDVHPDWVDQIQDDWPATWEVVAASRTVYGDDMAAFLCWLGVRLMEMHRVLRDHGSIYLHIDRTAHAYVKLLMDSIFRADNFRNEIVWCYRGGGVPRDAFAHKHDTILRYSASKEFTFHKQFVPYSEASTKLVESRGGVSIDKRERNLERGATMPDWWADINSLQTWSPERTGYPTQKPLALYERIIKASSNPGDVVLDPFCGCATTPIAAERTGRRWLGMDIWDGAHDQVLNRLKAEGLAVPDDEPGSGRLITFGDVSLKTKPPQRTDDDEIAAPMLKLKTRRATEPWQKLSKAAMRNVLVAAQLAQPPVSLPVCAGCGRELEEAFLELDHIRPRSDGGENFITNRVLLCGPCNSRKSNDRTMVGLRKENKQAGWMVNEEASVRAQRAAQLLANSVRDDWDNPDTQALIDGR